MRHTFAASALERPRYRVLEAADAGAALCLLELSPPPRVDLLFTDVVLPRTTSGHALAETLPARLAALPVVFASGYTGARSASTTASISSGGTSS